MRIKERKESEREKIVQSVIEIYQRRSSPDNQKEEKKL